MTAVDASVPPSASGNAKLTKIQKLAALLVMLGPEGAACILKHLDAQEIDAISAEMSNMSFVDQELQREILAEFSQIAIQAGTSVAGGVDFVRSALERAVGQLKAAEIIGRVAPARTPVPAMQSIADMESRHIFNLIRHENPQTIALVLSYLAPEKAAETMAFFRVETRDRVIERIATLAPTPIEVVEKLVEVLTSKRGSHQTRALNQTGGIKTAADLLNAMDKNVGKSLLSAIEERNAELGVAIRHKMFTFEDLTRLEASILQRILREVDLRDLAIALKPSSDKLKKALLGCISKRAAETVNEEIAFMGPIKLRDIEGAQLKIIEVVRRLETEGEVDLGDMRKGSAA